MKDLFHIGGALRRLVDSSSRSSAQPDYPELLLERVASREFATGSRVGARSLPVRDREGWTFSDEPFISRAP